MANNKTLRRQQAAAATAAKSDADGTLIEEVLSDVPDTLIPEDGMPDAGMDVADQAAGSLEGDRSNEEPAAGSDAPQAFSEQSEGLVGDESDGPAVQFLQNDEGRELATRDGAVISDRGLTEFVTPVDELPQQTETPVSEEEQAASTAALLAQEPQPEPDAPAVAPRRLDALLAGYTLEEGQPVIDPDYVGQQGFDPTLAPADDVKEDAGEPTEPVGELPPAEGGVEGADDLKALEESAEDEQAAIQTESFASVTTEANLQPVISAPTPEVDAPVAEVVEEGEPDYTTYSDGRLRAVLLPKVGQVPSEAWSREDMLLYLIKGVYPQKTGRNNWIYDARRSHRVKAWTASEILDFIEGKLQLDTHVDETTAWEEAYARYKAPSNWTIEAFREYVCNGAVPEYTASGVLVNDRQRDQKQVHHLTFRELRAALLGNIETKFDHEQLLSQYRKRLGISESYSEERLLAEMPNQPDEVSMDNTILRAKLDEYKAAITKNPNTQTEATAGACQGMLYKAIRQVTKREFNEFVEGWNIILDFVNENYAALFDPYKARRGWSEVALSKQQLQLFEDLLTVIIATRQPGNRASQLSHNLEIVLRHLPEENERQNFFMYYQSAS